MAINYTLSYTFSPNTTISSSQVNTNFSDNANTWTGLEALTKSFAKLKVDVDPTTALEVATKQYVDHYSTYRRPVLQYASGTVVNIETGIDGTAGEAKILFPDGTIRTDSTAGRINCNLAQVAALSGTWQSGLRTGTVSANTWYYFYAVKTTDDTAKFVTVADSNVPTQGSYATLNSNFGGNSWVYLGALPYGDGGGVNNAVPKFVMCGNTVSFYNAMSGSSANALRGWRLANTAGATTLTWTYASGSASQQVPANMIKGTFSGGQTASTSTSITDSGGTSVYASINIGGAGNATVFTIAECALAGGLKLFASGSTAQDIALGSYSDVVLGVGANPTL